MANTKLQIAMTGLSAIALRDYEDGPAPAEMAAYTLGQMAEAIPPRVVEDLRLLWAALMAAVSRVSPFAYSYLKEAHPLSLVGNVFTIGFHPDIADHIAMVDNARNRTLLQIKLAEVGRANVEFKFVKVAGPAA